MKHYFSKNYISINILFRFVSVVLSKNYVTNVITLLSLQNRPNNGRYGGDG